MDIDKLLDMQQQLMEEVPHGVRADVYLKMLVGLNVFDSLLIYLNSCGHKPWRPNPLSKVVRDKNLVNLQDSLRGFVTRHDDEAEDITDTIISRRLVSVYGIIEEAAEYKDSLANSAEDQLEELTDILFFYLELVAMSGFTLEQIGQEYERKWHVNIDRYKKGKAGDWGWDKRAEKKGL